MLSKKYKINNAKLSQALVVAGSMFFVTAVSHAQEAFDEKWFSCTEDSQCVLVKDTCGFPKAVNQSSLEKAAKWYGRFGDDKSSCTIEGTFQPERYELKCLEKQCVVIIKVKAE